MMKNLIFMSGYFDGDDELTSMKGHRSDVLIEDTQGMFYELNFIDLNRLRIDFMSNKEKGKNYFTDTGLIILDTITKDSIIKSVYNLIEDKYFLNQKPQKRIKSDDWYLIPL